MEPNEDFYKLYVECAYLAILINHKTKYCVFFDYYGHVDLVTIRLRESKENYNKEIATSEFGVSMDVEKPWRLGNIGELTRTRDRMKRLLETGEVDISEFGYEDVVERYYTF